MSELEGWVSMKTPKTRSKMGRAILEFMESDEECIGKRYDDPVRLNRDIVCAKSFVANHHIRGVRVRKRADMLIFVKVQE